MRKVKSLIGQKFGRLTVLERAENSKSGQIMWKCICSCPDKTVCVVSGGHLKNGHTNSCGCLQKERASEANKTHGQRNTRLYNIWVHMKQRCNNPNNPAYRIYGAEGKTVCEEWIDKKNGFINFYNWSMANGYRDDLTIERTDGTKGYTPENCGWATAKEQANNLRNNHLITYNGETHTMKEWARKKHINYKMIFKRIKYLGWSIEEALETPVRGKN